jgi:hypothetical protein
MFDSLHSLSDKDVISGTRTARVQEHRGLLSLIVHLIEFERRSLHLKLGHHSLYNYCVSELGYCESSAMRRITAARCIAKFPDIYPLLESNRVNLSTLSRVSKILTPENCTAILERLCGKSLREVEAIVAEYEPATALPRDRVRTVVVRVPVKVAAELDAGRETHTTEYNRNGGKESSASDEDFRTGGGDRSPVAMTPAQHHQAATILEHRSVVQFAAREEFMNKVEKARCLVWHQLPGATLRNDGCSANRRPREGPRMTGADMYPRRYETRCP